MVNKFRNDFQQERRVEVTSRWGGCWLGGEGGALGA